MRRVVILVAFWAPLLLAGDTGRRVDQMGRRFQRDGEPLHPEQFVELVGVLSVIGAAVIIGLIVWLAVTWIRVRREREYHSLRKLFLELSRAHNLSAADRQLMHDVAAWHQLPHDAMLFVDPSRFLIPAMIQTIGRERELADLKRNLFGSEGGSRIEN